MKTVLVTGASGLIAQHLAQVLTKEGFRVLGISRGGAMTDGFAAVYRAALLDSLDRALDGEPVDIVVHCANHAGKGEYRVNVDGTGRWLKEADAMGVGLQIFLSSLAAAPDALSAYGRAKYDLEQQFIAKGHVVFRLGLVVGNGGMFLKIRRSLERLPVVPLLDGGRSPVYVIGIDRLCDLIRDCIVSDCAGRRGRICHVHQPTPHSLRELMHCIRRAYRYSRLFVPVPSLPVVWALSLAERVPGMNLPVTSTHLRGMRQSRNRTHPSDFLDFGYTEESLEGLVERVARVEIPE